MKKIFFVVCFIFFYFFPILGFRQVFFSISFKEIKHGQILYIPVSNPSRNLHSYLIKLRNKIILLTHCMCFQWMNEQKNCFPALLHRSERAYLRPNMLSITATTHRKHNRVCQFVFTVTSYTSASALQIWLVSSGTPPSHRCPYTLTAEEGVK